jgi:hypothetical protein
MQSECVAARVCEPLLQKTNAATLKSQGEPDTGKDAPPCYSQGLFDALKMMRADGEAFSPGKKVPWL